MKSGLVDEPYEDNYAWSCEGDNYGQTDDLYRLALPVAAYYDDPFAREEIAVEILELEHLVNSEFLGSSLEADHLELPEEDFKQFYDCMNEKK